MTLEQYLCLWNHQVQLVYKLVSHPQFLSSFPISHFTLGGGMTQGNIDSFPCGSVLGNLPTHARDVGLIPGPGGSHMLRNS